MTPRDTPATVWIRGASLAALAAAARLGKAGHHVVLDCDGLPDGGHWAVRQHLGVEVDELPQTFLLPAVWRDLFKKSGRALDAELARHHLDLVPAPDQVHRFADGRTFCLPSERGAQFHAVDEAFGRRAAEAWCTLLDDLDDLWQRMRPVGLERPVGHDTFDRRTRAGLWSTLCLEDLAARAGDPHLACIVRSQASLSGGVIAGRTPALVAVRLAVHRRFGSWQLVDEASRPVRASLLVEMLGERIDLRGVERVGAPVALLGTGTPDLSRMQGPNPASAEVVLDTTAVQPVGFGGRKLVRPAYAPRITNEVIADDPEVIDPSIGIVEVQDHTAGTPVVSWHRPLPDGRTVVTTHDHTRPRPDLVWGLAPTSWKAWEHRPRLGGEGRWVASAGSHGGNEPWGELLSAALAVYEIHEYLTDEDIRPTNKQQPRLPRQARPASGV